MLIEIHMLQNHAPSNLNRDDTGSPKDCIFGGVRRSRISSQCLKRSIRRSPVFAEELGSDLASRTRGLPDLVQERVLAMGLSPELADLCAQKASGFGNKEGKEPKDGRTAQMMFLSQGDVAAVAEVLYQAAVQAGSAKAFKAVSAKDLQKEAVLRGWRPITPDIALFGRMITSDAFRDVEAAMQAAHAISTHKMDHEFDYFTAVDDLLDPIEAEEEKGAGMIGDVEFNSACYYKYFSLDVDALVENLAGPRPDSKKATATDLQQYEANRKGAEALARRAVLASLKAAVFTSPSGKQNSFAAHQLPDGILVEVRERKIPVSYANAFVKPVTPSGQGDLVERSLVQLQDHVERITEKFSLHSAARLWFTTRNVAIKDVEICETLTRLIERLTDVLQGRMAHG